MSTTAIRTVSDLSDGGYYLPSLAWGILYIHYLNREQLQLTFFAVSPIHLLILSILLLIAGSIMHSLEISISGPTSERSPTNYQTGVQRTFHVLYQQGRPSDYPTEWTGLSEIEYETSRKTFILVFTTGFSYLLLLISYPITIIKLFGILPESKYVAGAVIFIEAAFLLQTINQFLWPYSYLEEEIVSNVEITDISAEFRTFLKYNKSVELESLEIEAARGGEVEIEYKINSKENKAVVESIEVISYGFAGSFLKSDYPCQRLIAIIKEDGKDVGTYTIEAKWIEDLESGNIGQTEFKDKILSTLAVKNGV